MSGSLLRLRRRSSAGVVLMRASVPRAPRRGQVRVVGDVSSTRLRPGHDPGKNSGTGPTLGVMSPNDREALLHRRAALFDAMAASSPSAVAVLPSAPVYVRNND